MKLKLEIKMDNAAFADGDPAHEAARILKEAAFKINNEPIGNFDGDGFPLRDYNGNTVGFVAINEEAGS